MEITNTEYMGLALKKKKATQYCLSSWSLQFSLCNLIGTKCHDLTLSKLWYKTVSKKCESEHPNMFIPFPKGISFWRSWTNKIRFYQMCLLNLLSRCHSSNISKGKILQYICIKKNVCKLLKYRSGWNPISFKANNLYSHSKGKNIMTNFGVQAVT